jgi:hypothetical protein
MPIPGKKKTSDRTPPSNSHSANGRVTTGTRDRKPDPGGKPKLVNRGGSGLYGKLTAKQRAGIVEDPNIKVAPTSLSTRRAKYEIAPDLEDLVHPIDIFIYDPDNANLHPEDNLNAIKQSLMTFGQVKPIVVQKSTMHVVAGNGTLMCCRELGYTEIAACIVEMTDAEAAAYGLADNRTAKLAKWDFQSDVLKRLYARISEAELPMIGWTEAELMVMRMRSYVAPAVTEEEFEHEGKVLLKFNQHQWSIIKPILDHYRSKWSDEQVIYNIITKFHEERLDADSRSEWTDDPTPF